MNDVTLTGNLTRDPEVRVLANGSSVVNFTVASSRNFKKKDGTYGKETTFVDCEAWEKTAENIGESLSKGSGVFVNGSLKSDSWEDTDGNKRSRLKLRVNYFGELKSKESGDNSSDSAKTTGNTATKAKPKAAAKKETVSVAAGDDVPVDEDLPF